MKRLKLELVYEPDNYNYIDNAIPDFISKCATWGRELNVELKEESENGRSENADNQS